MLYTTLVRHFRSDATLDALSKILIYVAVGLSIGDAGRRAVTLLQGKVSAPQFGADRESAFQRAERDQHLF